MTKTLTRPSLLHRTLSCVAFFCLCELLQSIFNLSVPLFNVQCTTAQTIGSWQVYPAYSVCTYNIPVGSRIYALMESKLMAYDTEDESITTFDWTKQLNDVAIDFIRYNAEAQRIIIIYDNGNIDLLSTQDDADVINLPQLKNSTLQNKGVNNVQVSGSKAYVCTGFGIIVIDMSQGIILETYQLDLNVQSCAVSDKMIFAGTSTGMWTGKLTDNLQDKNFWNHVNTNYKAPFMEYFAGCIWVNVGGWIFKSNTEGRGFITYTTNETGRITYMSQSDGKLIYGNNQHLFVIDEHEQQQHYSGTYTWNTLSCHKNTFWASDAYAGLQAYILNADNTFSLTRSAIHPNSPPHDYSLHLRQADDRLLVAGGHQNYSASSRPGTAYILEKDGTWTTFDYTSAAENYTDYRYLDVTNVAQDPSDANHHFLGTARGGIYEFRNQQCVGHYGLDNTPFNSIVPTAAHPEWYTVADGLTYDSEGNLWVLNCTEGARDTSIFVRKSNGAWIGIPCPEIKEASTLDRIFFDSSGRVWINSRRMDARGIFMLDTNGTLERTSDDRRQLRSTIINQDNTTYAPDEFYCFAEDNDGQIWFGTNLGPFVINDPSTFRSSDFTFEQVKVSRDDGSGLADYLLSGIPITAIAIDGGQRKWFGSLGSGVYLISNDSQEELLHFTTSNSPLPSDNVYDIAIDGTTGRVFFATDKGLCSYLSDATQPEASLETSAVYAFPNPVDPDYHGPIIVRGLTVDSEVKILSSTGQLVWQGISNGGTFSWNGCNQRGQRVASGVYNVVAATKNGSKAIVTRIAFIH